MAKAELVEYDHLIKTKKVEDTAKIEDIANANSRFPRLCYVEPGVRTLQTGDFVQFLRRGYFKVDKIHDIVGADPTYEFIFTPDGKAKGLSSIATEVDKKGDIKKENLEEKTAKKKEKLDGNAQEGEKKEKKKEKKEGEEEKTAEEKKKERKEKKEAEAKEPKEGKEGE